jgi:hypothetical protein
MKALPRIRAGLLKHPLEKQVLVYDTITDRVHLLDPTTACVLELLEEGGHTAEEISVQIVARLDLAPEAGFLPLAIEELRKADLLDQSTAMHAPLMDRRELLQKVALTGAAALLIPAVASLTATRGYAQGTAPGQGVCNTCTSSSQCIDSQCCNGICMVNCTGNAVGACCNVVTQCAAGLTCCNGFCSAGQPTGAACSGSGAGACANNNAKNAANATCCSGLCDGGSCSGVNPSNYTGGTCT